MDMKTIFLSHSGRVKESLVVPFAQDLLLIQVPSWFDRKDLFCSSDIYGTIKSGIASSDYCAAFIDETFLQKEWTMTELNLFHEKEIKENAEMIFPILCGISKDTVYNCVPWLDGRAYESVSSTSSYAAGEREILLCRIIGKYFYDYGALTDISGIEKIFQIKSGNAFWELLKDIYSNRLYGSEDARISCMELCNIISILHAISVNEGNVVSDMSKVSVALAKYIQREIVQLPENITCDHIIAMRRAAYIMIHELLDSFNII